MSNFVPEKRHLREVLLHYFFLKKSESHRLFVEAYKESISKPRRVVPCRARNARVRARGLPPASLLQLLACLLGLANHLSLHPYIAGALSLPGIRERFYLSNYKTSEIRGVRMDIKMFESFLFLIRLYNRLL
ncbi:hypothetical protein ALC60_04356 [Trachymyrmex zeteki]|uniref:Mos1 transposase HTH domain-containing protein n=1 Tax=Mycetomoellerius zeteki TaxID=64791 RepID=A0A151X8Q6_9HYME|nr:hypothetical protein ALC60_04356 [Trachymyrmex zeteki]